MSRLDLLIARRLGTAPAAAPVTPCMDTELDRKLAALLERGAAMRLQAAANDAAWYGMGGTRD